MTSKGLDFRYVHPAVGVLVLSTVLMFILAMLGSGQVQEWINPGARIKVILPPDGLYGLSAGSDVEILGTRAGKVRKIVIDPKLRFHAEIRIEKDVKPFVRKDSKAIIRKRFGVAGASYLEITRGYGEPLDWNYAVLEATAGRAPTESVDELIADVREKILPVISDVQNTILALSGMINGLQNPQGPFLQLLENLNSISGGITKGEGTVGRLLVRKEMADSLENMIANLYQMIERTVPILDELSVTVGNVAGLSAKVNAQAGNLPEISRDVRELLASVNDVLGDLRRTTPELPRIVKNVGETTTSLPVLLIQTQQVVVELEQLIRQLRSNWLLGGGGEPSPAEESGRLSPMKVNP